jgi:hypothetical protein
MEVHICRGGVIESHLRDVSRSSFGAQKSEAQKSTLEMDHGVLFLDIAKDKASCSTKRQFFLP